jgi:hypothetical protein
MKTLIVHPKDESTTFLTKIYSNVPNKTIITKPLKVEVMDELIYRNDRVMIMGHGSSSGLFGFSTSFWMDHYTTHALRYGKENVYIWCNADNFIKSENLFGFYTGMFVSETGEAKACGLKDVTQEDVTRSNNMFSSIVSKYINQSVKNLHKAVKFEYGLFARFNKVAEYNWNRLYVR